MNHRYFKQATMIAMLCALAITLNILETMYLGFLPLGIRIGFANIVALLAIYLFGIKELILINFLRVVLSNLLRGTLFGSMFWISFFGVLLSTISLIILKKNKNSLIFSSLISSIFHSLGQIIVVCFIYSSPYLVSIFPYLLIVSLIAGYFIGKISLLILTRIKPIIH